MSPQRIFAQKRTIVRQLAQAVRTPGKCRLSGREIFFVENGFFQTLFYYLCLRMPEGCLRPWAADKRKN